MAKKKQQEQLKTVTGIPTATRDLISAQAIREIAWARRFKQGKVRNWQRNEQMYYSKKTAVLESRANVDLARMQEFVHTLLSKIDNPLTFKFTKRKEAQLKRVELLNSLKTFDADRDNWDMKDIAGKKQALIYGRAIYHYNAESGDSYRPNLENIDVYNFLIDPSAGGIDIEQARYLGDYSVVLSREDLEQGVENGLYDKAIVGTILQGSGNNTESNQEQTNKMPRTYDQTTFGQKELQSDDKFKFWRWHTTYYNKDTKTSERYYLLMRERGDQCIRIEKLVDLTSATDDFPMSAWPYWTWAAFVDLTEFWTPSFCDYAREVLLAQNVTINQMLDNAEAVNKPQKAVVVGMVENPNELKYRRDGIIKVKTGQNINNIVQLLNVPSIDTPLKVFDKLEAIYEKATGVSAVETGNAATEGKVGIYEGNKAENADRFGLLNKSYSFGYKRFARLYEIGVKDHLIKKIAIDIIGPDGIEVVKVSKRDLYKSNDKYGLMIEASNAETLASAQKADLKAKFLIGHSQDPLQNQKKAYEMEGKIVGFTEDEINELMDTSEFGSAQLMARAASDIEGILNGEDVKPNQYANAAYAQKILDYAKEHVEELKTTDKFNDIMRYLQLIKPIVIRNEERGVRAFEVNQMTSGQNVPATPANNGAEVPVNGTGIPAAPINNNQPVR